MDKEILYLIVDILEHIADDLDDKGSYDTDKRIKKLRKLIGYGEDG